MSFDDATSLEGLDDGVFVWDVADGWQQGRGAWGGLVAGAVARAVETVESSAERPLRTLSLHLAGPVPVGRATVRVSPLRIGSGLSTWSVIVEDAAGDLCAHAVVLTGRGRVPDLAAAPGSWGSATPPEMPPWADVAPLPSGLPGMPTFLQHLELRVVAGLPTAGRQGEGCLGYVQFAEQDSWDAPRLIGIVDAWYPVVLTALDTMRPLATVTFAAHLLIDPASIPLGEPLVYEASLAGAHEGFTTETRRLWTSDGRLAVENHQSVVVIA